jgi:PIN domain nuclease of toxin-antitoxin system
MASTSCPSNRSHTAVLTTLPIHHRDPFDRLLVAQAMVEQIPIVSVDTAFDAYPVDAALVMPDAEDGGETAYCPVVPNSAT